jgi:hypothetical protein
MLKRPLSWLPLLLIAGLSLSAPACASQGYYAYQRDYYRDIERRAYETGYGDGLSRGDRDARRGRTFSYERHDEFRDADDGYRRGYGDRELYRRAFRQGFQAGYNVGFRRIARERAYPYAVPPAPADPYVYSRQAPYSPPPTAYPSPAPYGAPAAPGVYSTPAVQIGYRDGYDAGRDDARDRRSYDPIRCKRYRSGDHDYDNRYGPKDVFQREYRAAFQQGYELGYRESRRD